MVVVCAGMAGESASKKSGGRSKRRQVCMHGVWRIIEREERELGRKAGGGTSCQTTKSCHACMSPVSPGEGYHGAERMFMRYVERRQHERTQSALRC